MKQLLMVVLATGLLVASGNAQAARSDLPPINENPHIIQSLLSAAIGDEIRKNCPTISARMFRAYTAAKDLERYALEQGYSEGEIEAFLDSKAERKAMRARRDAYLAKNGVTEGEPDSYCALGKKEIADGSLTGWLLREN